MFLLGGTWTRRPLYHAPLCNMYFYLCLCDMWRDIHWSCILWCRWCVSDIMCATPGLVCVCMCVCTRRSKVTQMNSPSICGINDNQTLLIRTKRRMCIYKVMAHSFGHQKKKRCEISRSEWIHKYKLNSVVPMMLIVLVQTKKKNNQRHLHFTRGKL